MQTIEQFAEVFQRDQKEHCERQYPGNWEVHEQSHTVKIKHGKKYTKVDIGTSGRYMIDQEGNIYGIKAYGVIHRGHHFGTLDTINNYNWGGYRAYKK